LFPRPEVVANITCYCCGHEGGQVIANPLNNYPDNLEFFHKKCGQKSSFQDALIYLFQEKGIRLTPQDISAGKNKLISLTVSNYNAKNVWGSVNNVTSKLGDYPLIVRLMINDQISNCPICGEKKFFRKGNLVVCENDGLTIQADNFVIGSLLSLGYKYQTHRSPYSTPESGENMYSFYVNYATVAWIILRKTAEDDQIVIVGGGDPNQESTARFREVVVKINDGFPEDENERFSIILTQKI
jgi:hypothetical protein